MAVKENKKVKVGLVQIGDRFGDEYYLPYSIGILQAYAQKYAKDPKSYDFIPPIYKREKISDASQLLSGSKIIFFSVYVWNFKISLAIAEALKKEDRERVIVFGGPQVPESKEKIESFLRKNHQINIACCGEGEVPFVKILDNLKDRTWKNVPSIGYLDEIDSFVFSGPPETVEDLNNIPSPYLVGTFDPLINNKNEKWSALIETNRGCPFTCAFCYWGSNAKSRISQFDEKRVYKEIDWISQRKIEFVFCCDANFGILPRDAKIAAKVAENKKNYGYPKAFSVQNTKNSTDKIFAVQKMLNDSGLQKGVNLALQSVDEGVLRNIKRTNIKNEVYTQLQKKFTDEKIATFSDMIIGLPGETYETFTRGVSSVIENGQHNRIQFINLVLLENTAMADKEYLKKHGLVVRESYIFPHHTAVEKSEEVKETQDLVVGTSAMPPEDWSRTRIFCWMMSLLYFNKLLQIPFAVMNSLYKISYKDLIESLMTEEKCYPVISKIYRLFSEKALEIKKGGQEHIPSKEWLGIWWPADEYVFIELCAGGGIEEFYTEAEALLKEKHKSADPVVVSDSVKLNKSLIKKPFSGQAAPVKMKHNIYEVYRGVLTGKDVKLQNGDFTCDIKESGKNWEGLDEWLKQVVWFGTKKGAYLYECKQT